jgi:signal peptidase I
VSGLPRWLPIANVVVADTSMQPALEPGDRLLVNRWSRPKAGDIVVIRDPEFRATILVKRVSRQTPSGVEVKGDNPNVSRDSRAFGLVSTKDVIGKAMYRYQPADRRGRVP